MFLIYTLSKIYSFYIVISNVIIVSGIKNWRIITMNSKHAKFLGVLVATVFLVTAGCAKKNKPDTSNDLAGVSNRDSIQDKDMSFSSSGSDSGKIEGLYTIHFEYDKSNLTEENRGLLVKDAGWLKAHQNESLQIEGHCDRHGSTEYNMALGQRRADTVMHYLINLGVSKDRLTTISYGKEKMLDTAETEAADTANRRANFKPVDSPKVNHLSQL